MKTTTVTIELRCGHEHVYDLAATTPLLRAVVVRQLALVECVSCRRLHAARHDGDRESSSSFGQVTIETALSERNAWERQEEMPELEGTQWAVDAGARVRFTLLSEALDWCSDREWTEEEFTRRVVVPARQRRDAAWWLDHRDCAPWDLEEALTGVEDAPDLDEDV